MQYFLRNNVEKKIQVGKLPFLLAFCFDILHVVRRAAHIIVLFFFKEYNWSLIFVHYLEHTLCNLLGAI